MGHQFTTWETSLISREVWLIEIRLSPVGRVKQNYALLHSIRIDP